ncbi:MAG: hypothetical protein GY725_19150 [bacterium]|nr:hypothetical protein [bacterium]
MKWLRRLAIAVGVLAVLGYAGWSYLTAPETVPETSSYELDLSEVRRLASSIPGAKPLRLNEELVAQANLPRGAVFAGEAWDDHPMVHRAFQIVYADRSWIVDVTMGEKALRGMSGDALFYADAFQSVLSALGRAEGIVFTHEHIDHIQGLALHPNPDKLASRVRFAAAQSANASEMDSSQIPGVLRETQPLDSARYLALAPGLVAIEAAGHTPGSQIIYVGLASGREFLLLGDVAWHQRQIDELIYRPRLTTDLILGEDRAAVLAQFRTLHTLKQTGQIEYVVSHDVDQRLRQLAAGLYGAHFERTAGAGD